MPDERSSGFYFNVQKWRSSRSVQRMSFAERGVYLEMLCEQWDKRNLPDDPEGVAQRIAMTPQQHTDVLAAWPAVRAKFVRAEKGPIRIYNLALERTRRAQRENARRKEVAGSIAGKASARKRSQHRTSLATTVERSLTTVERPLTEKKREEREIEKTGGGRETPLPDARSKRPIFSGQRLTVFEWMLDNCLKILGPHGDGFDLHDWFFALDQRAVSDGFVIPKRDGGAWLEAQLVAEAQRRGLPLRLAALPAAGKSTTRLAAALASIKASES